MPSLRITSSQEVFDALNVRGASGQPIIDSVIKDLRQSVAYEFHKLGLMMEDSDGNLIPIDESGIGASWFTYVYSQNEVSIQIEVVFSTSQSDFLPNTAQIRGLNRELAWTLTTLEALRQFPLKDGAVWCQPIFGGVYHGFEF